MQEKQGRIREFLKGWGVGFRVRCPGKVRRNFQTDKQKNSQEVSALFPLDPPLACRAYT